MAFDYSKLLGRMKERKTTQENLACAIGISKSTLSLKINNHASFNHHEIEKICKELDIAASDIGLYFFTPRVQ